MNEAPLAEIVASLALAAEAAAGEPEETSARAAVAAVAIAEALGLPATERSDGRASGHAPTGKTARVTGANVARLSEGEIVESWFNFDLLSPQRQLGVVPAPGPHRG